MTIFARVLDFIRNPDPGRFEELALEVFRYQALNVPSYGHYLLSLGVDPSSVRGLPEIPPLSTLAFKYAQTESVAAPPGPDARLFRTSGTTIGRDERGRHLVLYPDIYRASALDHLRRMFFRDRSKIAVLAMHPTADRMPESSLAQMITWAAQEFASETTSATTPEGVDCVAAVRFLVGCVQRNQPVAILSTTAACARLFDALGDEPLRLPAGSRLMDTGGAKGQVTPLSPIAAVELAESRLGLASELVINEYGMTEMCSQLYDATIFNSSRNEPHACRRKLGPPWLRPFAFDPKSMRPMADGQPGLLGFFDLANVGSVSMIVTEDIGTVEDGAVRIAGRAPSAEARGCALGIAEFTANRDADAG